MKTILLYLLIVIGLLSCGKSLVQQFGMVETRIQGKWELVKYTINDKELIDTEKFYFTKIKIDKIRENHQNKLRAFPIDCELCPDNASFYTNLSYDNSNSTNISFPNNYTDGNIDSIMPTTDELINLCYYNSSLDTVRSYAVYGYYWRIEKLSSRVLILNNGVGGPFNIDNIKMTFEKY